MTTVLNLMNRHIALNTPSYAGAAATQRLKKEMPGARGEELIRLNANENPFGTHPAIQKAIQNLPLHIYPDQNQERTRSAISSYVDFPQNMIVAGAGADDLIDLLMRLFIEPGDRILNFTPTFGMYEFCAKISAAVVVNLPRKDDWGVDTDSVMATLKMRNRKTKIIVAASPNNPTGNVLPEDVARSLLETGLLCVIDETYTEFAGSTLSGLLHEYDNLVILRSLSKWAGIAGLRVGYAIGSPAVIGMLMSIKQPYSVSTTAEEGALAALENKDALLRKVEELIVQRKRMESAIDQMDGVSYWESHGNFLLCKFTRKTSDYVYDFLAENGIFVRQLSTEDDRLKNTLRISVGTEWQTERLLDMLQEAVR